MTKRKPPKRKWREPSKIVDGQILDQDFDDVEAQEAELKEELGRYGAGDYD